MELTKLHIEWLEAQIVANNAQNAYFQALVEEMKGTGKDISPAPAIKTPEPEKMEEAPKKAGRPATVSPEDKKLRKLVADRVRNARQSFAKLGYTTDIKDYGELVKHYAEAIGTKVPDYETGREDVALKALLKVARKGKAAPAPAPRNRSPKEEPTEKRHGMIIAHPEMHKKGPVGIDFDGTYTLTDEGRKLRERTHKRCVKILKEGFEPIRRRFHFKRGDRHDNIALRKVAAWIGVDVPAYEEFKEDEAFAKLLDISNEREPHRKEFLDTCDEWRGYVHEQYLHEPHSSTNDIQAREVLKIIREINRYKKAFEELTLQKPVVELLEALAKAFGIDIPAYETGREDLALKEMFDTYKNGLPDDNPDPDGGNHDGEGKEAPEGDSPCLAAMEVEGGEAGATPVVSASAEAAPVDSKEEPGDLPGLVYWTDPRDTMPRIDRGNMVTSIVSLYSITGLPWRFNPAELGTMSKGELSRELMIIGTEWDIQRDYGIADEDELYLMALYSIINDVEESVAAKMSRDDLLAFFSRREVIDCLRRNAA